MMIIVTGPDRVGKSTFCKHLQDKYGLVTVDLERPQNVNSNDFIDNVSWSIKAYHVAMTVANFAQSFNFVVDRFHIDDIVYGNLLNRIVPDYTELEKKLQGKAIVLYLNGRLDNLIERWKQDKPDKINLLVDAYIMLRGYIYQCLTLPWFEIQFDDFRVGYNKAETVLRGFGVI